MPAFLRVNLELWQKADLTILRAAVFIDRQHTERTGVGTVTGIWQSILCILVLEFTSYFLSTFIMNQYT